MASELVSVDWLSKHLGDEHVIILDVSPSQTVGGAVSHYNEYMIPGAQLVDMKIDFSNTSGKFPNTIPSSGQFEKVSQRLGINTNSTIIVYDNLGIYTSPRAWWLFKAMGHHEVKVLNGGLPKWIEKGHEVVSKIGYNSLSNFGNFVSQFQEDLVIHYDAVLANKSKRKFTLVDARSEGRYLGTKPEPRKYLKSGHINGSVNIPYKDVLNGCVMKSPSELSSIFTEKLAVGDTQVFSCGSGVTACIVMLAAVVAGYPSKRLYDGSWSEYAELQGLTV